MELLEYLEAEGRELDFSSKLTRDSRLDLAR
jgi:hypothetical protein